MRILPDVAADAEGLHGVELMQHFGNTDEPEIAERILYTCVALPHAVRDPAELLPLAEMAAKLGPWSTRVVGAAHFRAGQYEVAARYFEEMDVSARRAWDWFFKAMNHSKLGNTEQARRCLDAGIQWLDNQNRTDPDALRIWGWTEQVESQQLRREVDQCEGITALPTDRSRMRVIAAVDTRDAARRARG